MKRLVALSLVILLVVGLAGPAGAQGPGLFIRTDCATITGPVAGQTWCFDATAQTLKVWTGANYATVTNFTLPLSVGNGGSGTASTLTGYLKGGNPFTAQATPLPTADLGLGWFNVKTDYAAKGNAKTVSDAAITSGLAVLTSATAAFVAGDVGKRVSVAGAGAAGVTLETTIATFTTSTTVTTAVNAGTTVTNANMQFGTDDTAAVQNAINAAVGIGVVYFPPGKYFTDALNLTGKNGVVLLGAGSVASQLWPWASAMNHLDFTGSTNVLLQDLQVGAGSTQASVPNTGLLIALNSGGTGNLFRARGLFAIGKYTKATVYIYGHTLGQFVSSSLYNYNKVAGSRTVALTGSNIDTLTSAFATIASGTKAPNSWEFVATDIQEWINGGAVTNGVGLLLDGANDIHFLGGEQVGSAGTAYTTIQGTCTQISFRGWVFDPGGGTNNTNGFLFVASPTITNFALHESNLTNFTNLFSGAVTSFNAGTANRILQIHSSPSTAILAGATRYVGPAGDSAADLSSSIPVPSKGILNVTRGVVNNAPGAGETYTITVEVNGVDSTLTYTMSGAGATTGSDLARYVAVAAGDRVSIKFVSSGGALTAFFGGSIGLMPY